MPILTTEQIRVLNDARTILQKVERACSLVNDGNHGRCAETAMQAEYGVFQILNILNSHGIQKITEDQMHNREDNPTRWLGDCDDVRVESDERGWEIHFTTTEHGTFITNVHAVSEQLLGAVQPIEHWLEEGRAAARSYVPRVLAEDDFGDDDSGYDPSDPKHPDYHSVHSDIWDARADK